MDEKTTIIDGKQFFAMSYIYLMCNELARGINHQDLKQDIWIANVIGLLSSIVLFSMFYLIYKNSGCSSFTEAIEHILGKYIAKAIFIIYPLYFIMQTTYVVSDMVLKIDIFMLEGAPFYLIAAILIFTSIYIVTKGIEPLARSVFIQAFMAIMVAVGLFVTVVLVNKPDFTNLKPFLEVGLEKVTIEGLKMSYSIPFGETFALVVLFSFVDNKSKNYKFGVFGIITAGAVMSMVTILCIAILGPFLITTGKNPSLQLFSQIEYQSYIQRFDLIALCIKIVYVVYRCAIYILASMTMIKKVIKFPDSKNFIPLLAIGLLVAIIPELILDNFNDVIYFRLAVCYNIIQPIFEVAIPILIIAISFFRKKKSPVKKLNVPIPQIIS